ncbi:MAG: DUF3570 domain-containing protein [Gammaproteobacteria bacterium]|nr:DUF3570 domain-containing protein [Gammaproteobacteria bacterium]
MFSRRVRQRAVRRVVKGGAVAAIRSLAAGGVKFLALSAAGCSLSLFAAVLPEDRFDALYHSYDGGGVKINGPSVLARKSIGESSSVSANYYVDSITSASIDVVTSASRYDEERTERRLGVDYLHDNVMMNLGYTRSEENDYLANTASFSISQEMFGDLTTVSMGYSRGWDTVGKRGQEDFAEDVARQNYRIGVSQVISKNTLLDIGLETVTDEGFLNNPYRSVRYLDAGSAVGYSFEPEDYPRTRDSNAFSLKAIYYLPYRATVSAGFRYFSDSWGIQADTYEIGYTHPTERRWIFDIKYRLYSQNHADFYSDLFPRQQAQNFLARDKELSTFSSTAIGLGASYELAPGTCSCIDKGTLTLSYDRINFTYDDFRDISRGGVSGDEPFYDFSADVIQFYLSVWY